MKYLIIKNKNQEKNIINYLIKVDSLPQIQRRLNVFSADDKFQIEILNNKVSYRQKNRSKAIFVENKNLKYFFKSFDNSKDYYINDISFLKFKNCSILFNTYHGTIISTENERLCQILEKKFKPIRYDNINNLLYRNTVNFAKDCPSATLFFLIGYPEHQTMTRFMYPNKRLIKKQL